MKRAFITPLILLLAGISWASSRTTSGEWTYVVKDGGAEIMSSTASGAVTVPATIDGYAVRKVGYYSDAGSIFGYGNTSVTSVTIPDSVTSIGAMAFQACTSLTSVTIPDSVTSIEAMAFRWSTSLTSVTIPDSVTSIGGGAFQGCTGLTSVVIPSRFTAQYRGNRFYWSISNGLDG